MLNHLTSMDTIPTMDLILGTTTDTTSTRDLLMLNHPTFMVTTHTITDITMDTIMVRDQQSPHHHMVIITMGTIMDIMVMVIIMDTINNKYIGCFPDYDFKIYMNS